MKVAPHKLLLALAATLVAPPALAQDHSGHQMPMPTPSPAPAEDDDHAHMEHGEQPWVYIGPDPRFLSGCSSMALVTEDSNMDGAICRPVEASGTSRLPANDATMPGVHFGLGGD